MQKKMNKLLKGVILSSTLLLTACGGGGAVDTDDAINKGAEDVSKEGFPIVEEPIEMSLMAPGTGIAEWEDMPTLQEYEKMTNIQLDYTTPPISDFSTNFNLAFASGDLPDIIFGPGSDDFTAAMESEYGQQGLLLPLNDLIDEYAPNFKALMEENPNIEKSITTTDGNIYALPRINGGASVTWIRGPVWINGEWMENLGIDEVPSTTDELYDMLVRFRDEDPNGNGIADEIPLTDVSMDSTRPWLLSAFGIKDWGIEEVDGKVRYSPITDNYRGYLEFMNKLFEEELLDSEVFSQADEQKKAKGEENRLGMFPDWFSFFTTGQTEEEAMKNPIMGPMTSEYSKEPLFPMSDGLTRGAFAITKDNPNPAAAMRWVDYFYSPEGVDFINKGPAGYLWDWVDAENGKREYNPDLAESEREEYRGEITPDYGITTPLNGEYEALIEIGAEENPFEDFIAKETEEKINKNGEIAFPQVYLTDEEQDIVKDIEVDLETYVRNSEAEIITSQKELNDKNWEEYVSTIENMNLEDYISAHQSAYDRWAEADE